MIKQSVSAILIATAFMAGCKQESKINTIQDDGIAIEVRRLDDHKLLSGLDGECIYDVRISTQDPALFEQVSRQNMWFKMDSCFWVVENGTNVYPEIIEPVSNGQRNSFEYIIHFKGDFYNNTGLFFKDTFINKKTYKVALN